VFGSRFLSLLAFAVALVAFDGAVSHAPGSPDSAELPMPGDDMDGAAETELTLPPQRIASPSLSNTAGASHLESERSPATSPVTSRIFRPPISLA
jgi:hypothetical protein